MMNGKKFLSLLNILIFLILTSNSFALKENTHKSINREVAQRTINSFSLDYYVKTLGFKVCGLLFWKVEETKKPLKR